MNKKQLILLCMLAVGGSVQAQQWPDTPAEARPGTRWWWLGSAVDEKNLTYNLEEYARAGMGAVEITPIYGVQGNDANDIQFLSPRWMEVLKHTQAEGKRTGIEIDMNTGTGWPFGGPEVSIEDAASKAIFQTYDIEGGQEIVQDINVTDKKQQPYSVLSRVMAYDENGRCINLTSHVRKDKLEWKAPAGKWKVIALYNSKTRQKVKRAAPGGEGYVMNHLSKNAVKNYLSRFDRAFKSSKTSYPHTFFNDSYEVYQADWTEDFLDQFARRRGYKLEEHFPEFLDESRPEVSRRIVSDYRETISDLLLENFTRQWTDWAHKNGSITRNQAHGSPANLIDVYAAVDIPECEGFGLSQFHIKGLRQDSLTKKNDSDLSMLKYASSAAHIAGKPFTTSETFTWLTEHFRTSLSQCKPDMDLMFISGVNHMYFHGTTYSPAEAAWPGWKFYASIDMSPTNNIWRDAPAFFDYITRCQSFLQMGHPDNDFLVYLPAYDMWDELDGRLLLFDIHKMAKRAPRFIEAVHRIYSAGYDMDYISDNFIRDAMCQDGKILTSGGVSYKALVVPGARLMPADVLEKLLRLADEGATIVFLEQYPEDVPGLNTLEGRRTEFNKVLAQIKEREGKGHILFGTDYARTLAATAAVPEEMKTTFGLSSIRRSHPEGHHYFISALKTEDTENWIPLAVQARSAMLYNPMNGTSGKARLRQNNDRTEVFLQLASGESVILKTFANQEVAAPEYGYWTPVVQNDVKKTSPVTYSFTGKWGFRFVEAIPAVAATPDSVSLGSWTEIPAEGAKNVMGAACYATTFTLKSPADVEEWMLDLGDVRESARVRINGQAVATLIAVPYRCLVGKYLRPGVNTLEVEVTNLPANRIADMDRRDVPWRIYKDANIVNIHYKKDNYGKWEPVPSGLLGPVHLIPMQTLK